MSEKTILQEDGVILVEDVPIVETQIELQPDTPIVEIVTVVQNDTVDLGEPQTAMEVDWFGLPIRGKSAYQTWQELPGNAEKTAAEFIAAITGPENENAPLAQAAQAAIEAMKEAIDATAVQVGLDAAQTASDRCAAHCSALAAKASELAAAAAEADAAAYADAALAYRNAAEHFAERAETAYGLANASASAALDAKNQAAASAVAAATHVLEAEAWSNQAGNYASAAETMNLAAKAWRDDAESFAAAAATSRDQAQAFANDSEEWALSSSEAANTAETARSQAQNFRDEAALSATTAQASEAQATSQAVLATEAKNQAGDSAIAANISRNEASSFADQSGVYADSSYTASQVAVAASQNAEDSAEAANEAISTVEVYVNQAESFAEAANASNLAAQAAKSDSEAAASAANISKDAATAQATLAGTYATAASNSALTAAVGAAATMPSVFDATGTYFSNSEGTPSSNLILNASRTMETVAGEGYIYQLAAQQANIVTKGRVPIGTAQSHRQTTRQRLTVAGTGTNYIQLGWALYTQADGYIGHYITYMVTLTVAMGWQNASITHTSEQIKAGATYINGGSASTVTHIRPFVNGLPGNGTGTQQTSQILYQNVTSEVASQNYAAAAAISYSNARASETAAGNYASSASGSANTASIQAGNAATFASSASSSAAEANASSVAAKSSATLAATVGAGGLIKNAMFSDYPTSPGIPTAWSEWDKGALGTRQPGEVAAYAYDIDATNGSANYAIQQGSIYSAAGYYVLEADIWLQSGNLSGAGLLFSGSSGELVTLSFATDKDINEVAGNRGDGVYRFRKLVQCNVSEHKIFYAMANLTGDLFGSPGAKRIRWYRASVRPASLAEIAGQRADVNATIALAQILTEASIRASADTALATTNTSLQTQINNNSTSISNEITARTTADTALSDSISSLTTTVNGHTSTLTAQGSTLADMSGKVYSRYMIELNANGVATGLYGVASQGAGGIPVSSWKLRADNFAIVRSDDSGTQYPFIYDATLGKFVLNEIIVKSANIGVAAIGELQLGGQVVTAEKLQAGAVLNSKRWRYCPGSDTSPTLTAHNIGSGNAWMIQINDNFSGSEVEVKVEYMAYISVGSAPIDVGLYLDGTLIKRWNRCVTPDLAGSGWNYLTFRHTPSAGSHTYRWDFIQKSGATIQVGERALTITELKGGTATSSTGGSNS